MFVSPRLTAVCSVTIQSQNDWKSDLQLEFTLTTVTPSPWSGVFATVDTATRDLPSRRPTSKVGSCIPLAIVAKLLQNWVQLS